MLGNDSRPPLATSQQPIKEPSAAAGVNPLQAYTTIGETKFDHVNIADRYVIYFF